MTTRAANQMKRLRAIASHSTDTAGAYIGCDRATITRIENNRLESAPHKARVEHYALKLMANGHTLPDGSPLWEPDRGVTA